ncbi:MAG TPA: hypothetical protein VL727_29130 [Puia sp.]|nr:hypothetical protein [Puia sp.]
MKYPFAIRTQHSKGRRDLGGGTQVAETLQEGREKFNNEIKFWENEPKEEGEAVTVSLIGKDPVEHEILVKTIRG